MAADTRYRTLVGIVIGLAAVMLIVGQTILKSHLGGWSYVIYWLTCFSLTFLALVFAWLDILRLRRRARNEQRELIENALAKLPDSEEEKKNP